MTTCATVNMEPIPLRTLTVLLNYERVISDPRFMDAKLVKSSVADPTLIDRVRVNYSGTFTKEPLTIEYIKGPRLIHYLKNFY
jgi:hypothetical protein